MLNMRLDDIIARWRTSYDKIALSLVLFALLFSVIRLISMFHHERRELAASRWDYSAAPPPAARVPDLSLFQGAVESSVDLFRIDWRSGLMTPEVRVACVNCGRPIPYAAEMCPFKSCRAVQPALQETRVLDSNQDGLPDAWKLRYGFDIHQNNAAEDPDGDGFSNIEEYQHGTDPTNPASFPSPLLKLRLIRVETIPLPVGFRGIQVLPDGGRLFLLRVHRTGRDHYVRLNDTLGEFSIENFEEKWVDETRGHMRLKKEVSELHLRKSGQLYTLVMNRTVDPGETIAHLAFKTMIEDRSLQVKKYESFELMKKEYKVVDIGPDFLLLSVVSTGEEELLRADGLVPE